jgi:hypothetical protein
MTIKIKLSSGKEIELSEAELKELFGMQMQPQYPNYGYYYQPWTQQPYTPVYTPVYTPAEPYWKEN